MNIQGFQKLTLLDYPGHTACTLFTGGCDLRCPFCHNVPLVLDPAAEPPIPEEEIFSFLEKRKGILDGVAVTGGEPMLQKDIGSFLQKIKTMGFAVKLDTNGSHPERLEPLIKAGLVDYVAMDIKNRREKYALTAGIPGLDIAPFEKSVSLLMTGGIEYEFRTTVIKEFHSPEDVLSIARWIQGAKHYYLQQFRDSGILREGSASPLEEERMHALAALCAPLVQHIGIRGI